MELFYKINATVSVLFFITFFFSIGERRKRSVYWYVNNALFVYIIYAWPAYWICLIWQ